MGWRGGHILTVGGRRLGDVGCGRGQVGQLRVCDIVLIVAPGSYSGARE